MIIVLSLSLAMYFYCFYSVGRLVANVVAKNRVKEIEAAAEKVKTGISAASERFVTPKRSFQLKNRLLEAGQPRDLDVDGFVTLKVLGAVSGLIVGLIIALVGSFTPGRFLVLMIMLPGIGFTLPDAWLHRLIARRKKEIARSLPDILDMLTVSVEAGLGFDAAVGKVVKNFKGPLAKEFGRWLQEVQFGSARKEAWRGLGRRVNLPEVGSFILAVLQADTVGVSIGKALRIQAGEMRVKRRQWAEEAAMKTPVKVVFPLVLCIFPALMIVIMGPAAIKIYNTLSF